MYWLLIGLLSLSTFLISWTMCYITATNEYYFNISLLCFFISGVVMCTVLFGILVHFISKLRKD